MVECYGTRLTLTKWLGSIPSFGVRKIPKINPFLWGEKKYPKIEYSIRTKPKFDICSVCIYENKKIEKTEFFLILVILHMPKETLCVDLYP